jgi:hypothetical protein
MGKGPARNGPGNSGGPRSKPPLQSPTEAKSEARPEVAATEERPAGADTNLRLTGADYLAALLTATPSLRAQFFGNPIRTIGKALPPSKYWDYGVGSKMSFRWRHPQQ